MKIERFQRDLEKIYRLEPAPPVEQFLISTEQAQSLAPTEGPQLLFQADNDEISLGVHLGDELCRQLKSKKISRMELNEFCSAAEEISHFLYLIWSAKNGKALTLLDLELQAEIDKFVLASFYFQNRKNLFEQMFEEVVFDPQNIDSIRLRYHTANRLGAKFCRSLGRVYRDGVAGIKALQRLRRFYRMDVGTRRTQVELL